MNVFFIFVVVGFGWTNPALVDDLIQKSVDYSEVSIEKSQVHVSTDLEAILLNGKIVLFREELISIINVDFVFQPMVESLLKRLNSKPAT